MIPATRNTMTGSSTLGTPAMAAGLYAKNCTTADGTSCVPSSFRSYTAGIQYNNKMTNTQGKIDLIIDVPPCGAPPCALPAGAYYIKSNSITSVAFSGNKDVTVYTKASIYRIDGAGKTISIDGAVTLRMDAHDGGTNDTIGFTVLSSKDGSLYYSNNWVWDPATLSFRTVPQPVVDPSGEAVVIF